jgi:hypothetical protein
MSEPDKVEVHFGDWRLPHTTVSEVWVLQNIHHAPILQFVSFRRWMDLS